MLGYHRPALGSIEVIVGCMFSGKSEELIRRLRRARIARQRIQIFKPLIDQRYSTTEIVSHTDQKLEATLIEHADQVLELLDPRTEVVGIDEIQFFPLDVVAVCDRLANMGKRIIAAGLDMDYRGEPFDTVATLMARAEQVTKTLAICVRCGGPAMYSQRLVESEERIVVGAQEAYEPRCRRCFEPHSEKQYEIDFR